MKKNGGDSNNVFKTRKTNRCMKTTPQSNTKQFNTAMKTPQTNRKKKEPKTLNIESAAKDTIAETIAFVIKGQLTPIKPTPLPVGKSQKHVTKRLQKSRCCKITKTKIQNTSTKLPLKSEKNILNTFSTKSSSTKSTSSKDIKSKNTKLPAKSNSGPTKTNQNLIHTKRLSKSKNRKKLDSSITKIIKKYAKKFNIKSGTQNINVSQSKNEEKKSSSSDATSAGTSTIVREQNVTKIIGPKSKIRKPSLTIVGTNSIVKPRKKYLKRKDETKNENKANELVESSQLKNKQERQKDDISETPDVKIKEEKLDEEYSVNIKTEPDTPITIDKPCEDDIVTEIKTEPILECRQKEVTAKCKPKAKSKIIKNKEDVSKKKTNTNKLHLLQKKSVNKKAQKQFDDKRRAKLLQFWNSPKRHRVASLNAIAKVHCLYENESKAVFDKIAENAIIKREPASADSNSKKGLKNQESEKHSISYKTIDSDSDSESEEEPVKRILRDVPGLRAVGKHWDMHDCISSDNNSDIEIYRIPKKTIKVKKEVLPKKNEKVDKPKKLDIESQKKKRKPKQEVYMDLKDMVVKKRMASLNASAILAASYSTDKKVKPSRSTDSSSYDSDSSAEEYFAAVEQIDLTKDTKEDVKQEEDKNLIEVHTTPNKKVAVILNQDTDVTITGVYVNSTTRSTHHEGYCSIAGMQYRISATSHTQTAATAVATETLLQSSSSSDNAHSDAQSCSSKSYTPLDALSNMQPPPGPGIHNTPSGIPCQSISQLGSPQHRQHPSTSAFTSPHHGPPGYLPPGQGGPPPPGDSPVGYVHGYYQPAGPLISVSHGHGQPPVQQPPLPKSVPLSDASPNSVTSVHQSQPPPAPSSNNGDSSDNEVIITSVTSGTKDLSSSSSHQPNASYRYPQYSQYHTYPCPPQYHYQTPPPPTPPYPHHEICYPAAPPAGYMRHTKYAPSPSATYHRYPYYSGHASELYPPTSAPPAQPSQQIVTATPVSANGSYAPAPNGPPPPPAIMESYAPPPAPPTLVDAYPPTPHYYQSAYGLPPTCYSHSPTRAIPYINATYQHCPCPLNTCPKNGHTGPLTGESKRSNIPKDSKPLPPVALALPLEPVSATGPPSPARGSAGMPSGGMPPPPSPAGANYQQPTIQAPKQESRSPEIPECKVEKRKARVGKANVRNNMQSTMLLMCNPTQDYVKREIESPKDKEELHKKEELHIENNNVIKEDSQIPEACTLTTCTKENCGLIDDIKNDAEVVEESVLVQTVKMDQGPLESSEIITKSEPDKSPPLKEYSSALSVEEPLPPCIATVAENVKVKNMKRKQSQSKEKVPEAIVPPPTKKKKISSYKDFIRKHTSCFKISNGKKKLVSKATRSQLPKIKLKTTTKKKMNVSKQQTNNRRMKGKRLPLKESISARSQIPKRGSIATISNKKELTKKKKVISKQHSGVKTAPKILDNLIAKNNIDKVIEDVIHKSMRTEGDIPVKEEIRDIPVEVKKSGPKVTKQIKIGNTKASASRRKSTSKCKTEIPEAELKILKKPTTLPKWSNGWMWEGEPYEGKVFINSDETTLIRRCYPCMKHKEGDLIRPGDCVLLKAGPRKNDLPYVAKIAALWENPEDGEMMMSLLWYYRPEHTEQGRLLTDQPDEVFASRHKDSNLVACIDDKCYVLTFNEYCRYKKNMKRAEEGLEEWPRCVPLPDPYPRISKQPPSSSISPEMVFFCRKVYDFRQKRIIKNPT